MASSKLLEKFDAEGWLDPRLFSVLNGPVPWLLDQNCPEKLLKQVLRGHVPQGCPTSCLQGFETLKEMLNMPLPGVFRFPCLNEETCKRIVEEMEKYETSEKVLERPNSMNKYGAILTSLSVDIRQAIQEFTDFVVNPLSRLLFPLNPGHSVKHVHGFIVKYKVGQDLKLARHVDDSDMTLNVNLGKQFNGGQLFFEGAESSSFMKQKRTNLESLKRKRSVVEHELGVAVFHVGSNAVGTDGHVHGAQMLEDGERWNFILWRNPSFGDKLQKSNRPAVQQL